MLTNLFETRPGRAQEFFKLLRYIGLLIMGPTAALQYRKIGSEMFKQSTMAAIAIYGEATLEAFIYFIDTIRFFHLWRTRATSRPYTRRLRGFGIPNFIVRLEDSETGVQVISGYNYARVILFAGLMAGFISIPVIVFDITGIATEAVMGMNSTSLFLLVTIGTGGNVLTGMIFLIERFDAQGILDVQGKHVRVVIPLLYALWIVFAGVEVVGRVWVYTSSNTGLRALATVYLFGVGTDFVVMTGDGRFGRIDGGRVYVGLRECRGVGRICFDTERSLKDVCLDEVLKIV